MTSSENLTHVKFFLLQKLLNSKLVQKFLNQRNENKPRIKNLYQSLSIQAIIQIRMKVLLHCLLALHKQLQAKLSAVKMLMTASHQVTLQVTLKRSSGSHYCGGSIISADKVMCAAHCKQSNDNWTAGAGSAVNAYQRQGKNYIYFRNRIFC